MSVTNITVLVNGNSQVVTLPYTIPANTTVTLTSNITLQYITDYFIIGGSSVVLDGGYFTVTTIANFVGLVHSDGTTNIYTNILIQHFGTNTVYGIIATYNIVYQNGVYICNIIDNNSNNGVTVKYCSSSGFNLGAGAGGIWSTTVGPNSTCICCYSNNTLGTGGGNSQSGGIYGRVSSNNGTSINCYTTGPLTGGYYIGGKTITNCFNSYNAGILYNFTQPVVGPILNNVYNVYNTGGYWNESVAEATLTGSPKYYNPGNNPPVNVSPVFGTTWISLSPSMPYILMSDNPDFNTVSYIQSSLGKYQFYNASLVNAVFY